MAEKSFLMYKDWGFLFDTLSLEDRGELITAVFTYQRTGKVQEGFPEHLMPFMRLMAGTFMADDEKYYSRFN